MIPSPPIPSHNMEIDNDPAPTFAHGTRNFATWFQALTGATFRSDLVSIEDLRQRGAGRGISKTILEMLS